MPDYYKILDVDENANQDEIKKSYRKLAMKWHPDRNASNPKAEEKFKEIQVAYDTIGNPQKRKEYDFTRHVNSSRNSTGSSRQGFSNSDFDDLFNSNFKDIFSQNFSDIFNQRHFVPSVEVPIGFWEAISGCKKTFQFNLKTGNKNKLINITVDIPPGTDSGDSFLIEIEKQQVQIVIHIQKDNRFHRENLDLFIQVDIPFSIAALGGEVVFPHWNGDIDVRLPECLHNGQKIVIPNKGVTKGIFKGDLHLIVNIVLPKKLNEKQKQILKDFQKTEEKEDGFLGNIKNVWKKFF